MLFPRKDPRAEVGEDVRVGVGVRVGPMELQLKIATVIDQLLTMLGTSRCDFF